MDKIRDKKTKEPNIHNTTENIVEAVNKLKLNKLKDPVKKLAEHIVHANSSEVNKKLCSIFNEILSKQYLSLNARRYHFPNPTNARYQILTTTET